jgi:hypothetical protein
MALAVAAALTIPLPSSRADPGAASQFAIPDDWAEWLQLYDEAGYPDVSQAMRIDWFTGEVDLAGESGPVGLREQGWLIQDGPIRVALNDSLWQVDLSGAETRVPLSMRRPRVSSTSRDMSTTCADVPGVAPREKTIDFVAALEAELAAREALSSDAARKEAAQHDEYLDDARPGPVLVYWLTRARWAQMKSRNDLALRALKIVDKQARDRAADCTSRCDSQPSTPGCKGPVKPPCDPIGQLREGFQRKLLWQSLDGLQSWRPRFEMLGWARRAAAMAPRGRYAEQALDLTRSLQQAVVEDAQHSRRPPRHFDAMTLDEKIDELVYLLRDQRGHRGSFGSCDTFGVPAGIRNPAQELVDLGKKAIPRLIPHVADYVPTRSVGGLDYRFSHSALPVGMVVAQVITLIARRHFDSPVNATQEDTLTRTRRAIANWWSRAAGRSDKEELFDNFRSSSEWDRAGLVYSLMAHYGKEAFGEIVAAYRKTKDQRARAEMLSMMDQGARAASGGELPAEQAQVMRFFHEALCDSQASVHLLAAQALAARGDLAGVGVVAQDLESLSYSDTSYSSEQELEATLKALLTFDDARAVEAIVTETRKGNSRTILALEQALGDLCRRPSRDRPRCGLEDAVRAKLIDGVAASTEATSEQLPGSPEYAAHLAAARIFEVLRAEWQGE